MKKLIFLIVFPFLCFAIDQKTPKTSEQLRQETLKAGAQLFKNSLQLGCRSYDTIMEHKATRAARCLAAATTIMLGIVTAQDDQNGPFWNRNKDIGLVSVTNWSRIALAGVTAAWLLKDEVGRLIRYYAKE